MNSRLGHPGRFRGFGRRVVLSLAVVAASLWFAPAALAHTRVGFGISIGVGNCWSCGYWTAPPVYYTPAYPAPVYYPPTVYYAPRPVYYGYYGYYTPRPAYYGYGYYGYYAPRHYRRDFRYRRGYHGHGGWHHPQGHYYHGHR